MVLRPALSDQTGPAWFITTPAGLNWFHDLWQQADELSDWSTFSYTTIEGGQVSKSEVEAARNTLDERTFRQEYLANFETLSGRVYPGFSDDNISTDVKDTGGIIYWGTDFNVSIMLLIQIQLVQRVKLLRLVAQIMTLLDAMALAALVQKHLGPLKIR
jgi:hypothetical protein